MRDVMMTGPEAPEGHRFCGVCAMVFKQQCLEAVNDQIQAAIRGDAKDGVFWLDLAEVAAEHDIPLPALGVTMALSTVFENALMEGCWSHAKPVRLTPLAVGGGNGTVPLLGKG